MVFQLPWIHRWILLFTTADFLFPSADFALLIGGTGLLLAKVSSTDCWCSNIHLVKWRRDRKVLISKCALICDLHLLSLDKWPICRMFEFNLMARHVPSGEAFVVALNSLPSIKKLLKGIQCVVKEEYQHLAFPSIPALFLAGASEHSRCSSLCPLWWPTPSHSLAFDQEFF